MIHITNFMIYYTDISDQGSISALNSGSVGCPIHLKVSGSIPHQNTYLGCKLGHILETMN